MTVKHSLSNPLMVPPFAISKRKTPLKARLADIKIMLILFLFHINSAFYIIFQRGTNTDFQVFY